jgi:hypothetical protein
VGHTQAKEMFYLHNPMVQRKPMGKSSESSSESTDSRHLEDVPDGCGCVEMWERLSENRDGSAVESETQDEAKTENDD